MDSGALCSISVDWDVVGRVVGMMIDGAGVVVAAVSVIVAAMGPMSVFALGLLTYFMSKGLHVRETREREAEARVLLAHLEPDLDLVRKQTERILTDFRPETDFEQYSRDVAFRQRLAAQVSQLSTPDLASSMSRYHVLESKTATTLGRAVGLAKVAKLRAEQAATADGPGARIIINNNYVQILRDVRQLREQVLSVLESARAVNPGLTPLL